MIQMIQEQHTPLIRGISNVTGENVWEIGIGFVFLNVHHISRQILCPNINTIVKVVCNEVRYLFH